MELRPSEPYDDIPVDGTDLWKIIMHGPWGHGLGWRTLGQQDEIAA